MPSWLSTSLVNQARGLLGNSRLSAIKPSTITQPAQSTTEEESEYEEIEHIHNYSNMNPNSRHPSGGEGQVTCGLCGNEKPLVVCEMCNNQLFCASCNDMFHRHPRRHNHRRKLLEPLRTRPPDPSQFRAGPPQFEAPLPAGPVPPPRRIKKFGLRSANASPTFFRHPFEQMGSLRRMGSGSNGSVQLERPLPMPPLSNRHEPFSKQSTQSSRNRLLNAGSVHGTWDRRQSAPFAQQNAKNMQSFQVRSGSIANPGFQGRTGESCIGRTGESCIPLTVMELEGRRYPSNAKGPDKYCLPPSRDSGWDEEEEEILPRGQRAFSVSACNLQQYPISSSDPSHFATLQRRGSSKPPARPPPPVPPRDFSQSRSMHPAASAFELDRGGGGGAFVPWVNNQSNQFQSFDHGPQQSQNAAFLAEARKLSTLQRNQASLEQAMSLVELNLRDLSRFDEQQQPAYGNQPGLHRPYPNQPEARRPKQQVNIGQRPMTPRQGPPAPPKPSPAVMAPPEPEYYSGDDGDAFSSSALPPPPAASAIDVDLEDLTESPQGPWTCEHCTFINAKSTRICTVCCKTPVKGYQIVSSRDAPIEKRKNQPKAPEIERHTSLDDETIPVIQSTLTFSNSKAQHPQKISLNNVEKGRKHSARQLAAAVAAAYESGSDSSSDSESSSSDEITEKHRSLVRENKASTIKKGKLTDRNEGTNCQTPANQSRNVVHNAPKPMKMVDSGTGDYSILDTEVMAENRRELKNSDSKSKRAQSPYEGDKIPSKKANEQKANEQKANEHKSSKGTSPPPQTISTQTYEELPGPSKMSSKMSSKSVSKISLQSSLQSRESSPPREMSEKALRYARRAQQHAQLKRSMSTHLTSATAPLADAWSGHRPQHIEGRHLYRSSSRQSLASDTRSLPISGPPSRDISPPPSRNRFEDFARMNRFGSMAPWDRFPLPSDYFASIDDMVGRKRRDSAKSQQEFELSRLLKEAEELNFSPEDVQVGLRMCGGDRNPVRWLEDNWANMVETVQTLATKFGRDKGQDFNEVGTISVNEAKDALRLHKGNVWAAVTECVEQRRKKFLELQSRGTFLREDILTSLTANKGNLDAAYVELSKNQLKPFLMRIWGPPSGKDNESVPPPRPQTPENFPSAPPQLEAAQFPLKSAPDLHMQDPIIQAVPLNLPIQLSPLSPEINETKDASRPESLMRGETEEETFYDPEFEPAVKALSISDGDIDESEAHVSAFIQNYDIPLPPPSPVPLSPITNFEEPLAVKLTVTEQLSSDCHTLGNVSRDSGSFSVAEVESLLESSAAASASQAIVTLSKAVNLIAEKLGVLVKTQQSGTKGSGTESTKGIEMENGKVGESGESEIAPESMPALPIKSEEVQTLKEIYKEDLSLLRDIILPEDKSVKEGQQKGLNLTSSDPQGHGKTYEAMTSKLPAKSTSSKIYEALGSFAGSFLRKGSSKAKAKAPVEENLYETIAVSQGIMEMLSPSNEIREILSEEKVAEKIENFTPPYRNSPNLLSSVDETFFDISRISSLSEIDQRILDSDDVNGILEVEHENFDDFSGGESSESEDGILSERDLAEFVSDEDSISEHELDAKWSEVALALNEASFQEAIAHVENAENRKSSPDSAQKLDAQLLLESGRVNSIEKAELAFKLMDMNFSEADSIHAANECSSLYTAISFLQQECQLCTGKFSAKQMVSMLRCKHACCRSCAAEYFMVQIRDQSILGATCPFCKEPANLTEDADLAADYFSHLEILLKDLLNEHFYDMFGRKLRDWTLAKTPNFKWCSKCSSGFITEPLQTHLICPDCDAVTCAICLEPWDKFNHEHRDQSESDLIFCDQTSKPILKSIVETLNDNNIECPKCHLKFTLARGGCMHLTCSQCRYEFCCGCSAPFAMGLRCKENAAFCAKLGLHAHHPRNCLFYLRDKEPELLLKLLKESNVEFTDNTKIEDVIPNKKCVITLQKETADGLVDDICGQEVVKGCTEVCQTHFTEYLGLLVWENRLDPIPILTNDDLETIVKRACKKMPPRSYGTPDSDYRPLLLQVIEEQIPL